MKMKTFKLMTLATALVFSAGLANAATLDFASEGASNERAVADGTIFTFGGVDVSVSGTGGLPYLDGLLGNRPAGLGDCSSGAVVGGECPKGSDDNITFNEAVTLTFDSAKNLSDLVFRGEKHYLVDEGSGELKSSETLLITTDKMAEMEYTFGAAEGMTFSGISSITLAFGGSSPEQFYLSTAEVSAVPLPAGILLMGTAMAGFGVASRRKKKKADV